MFETLQPAAYTVSFVFWALSTLTTCFRIFSREWIIQAFGRMTGGWVVVKLAIKSRLNLTLPRHVQLLFAEEIVYIWMQFAIKTGLLLFYLRLTNMTSFVSGVYATMGLNILITLTLWLLYCLQGMPLAAFWNAAAYPDAKLHPNGLHCPHPLHPAPLEDLSNCNGRLGIIATITVGGIAVVVSCLRVIILHRFAVDPDFTFILGGMVIISTVELNVAIMASNVPSLKEVWLRHVSGSLKGTEHTSSAHVSSLGIGKRAQERGTSWR
ncbi:hypothetical protein N7481_003361 [Penicillium waksmanii]|uniref:uncharacterized protein n=1 Tax=Penicillium waksmanii TaxID=69791 RepID=UPI0025468B26|nr:uncharacterized protein N7481_003361 [Penicillium waksmanii]KAJ5988151.1 hypothetical protein N7481_003361 [Penicillium waksmanii]